MHLILGNSYYDLYRIRVLYGVIINNSVLILHGFIKKSQKTPLHELRLALVRFDEWKSRNVISK
ncbi:type II toxin-antitoxin system RelE/ParE family toxin [Candidatus Gottesmanbacteria bacterium]|nr:type II toxin-antitoxin system RelE/ParE family toxin [Candidatus Gottesmanbacteria bacterium]